MIVKNAKANIFSHAGVRLNPGNNEVVLSWWLKQRNHPTIKKRLELGLLEEVTPIEDLTTGEENEAGELTASITDADAKQYSIMMLKDIKQIGGVNAIVRETFHPALLKAWDEVETRKPVKEAIKKQLALLKATPEKLDRSKARQIVTGDGVEVIELTAKPGPQDD